MKFLSVSKVCFALVLINFIVAACHAPYMNPYYIQQQNGNGNEENGRANDRESENVPPGQPLEPGKISMFSVILRDGKLAEPKGDGAVAARLQGKLGGSDASYTGYKFASDFFIPAKISIRGISNKFPDLHCESTGAEWQDKIIEDVNGIYKQTRAGNAFQAEGYTVSNVVYRRIYGESPFKLYANAKYEIYGEDGKPTGKYEPLMTRFVFYFFTGQTASPTLQNCLVAVDTYSKLVFQFGKPIDFNNVLGNKVPSKWAPVDAASTGQDGKKHRFYEYDPAGYVTEDGMFHMSDAYKNNLASGIYDPVYTGKSPYVGYVGDVQNPRLNISGIVLKNISIKDVGGDYPVAGSTSQAEFEYQIKARYNGGEWRTFATSGGSYVSIETATQKELAGNYTAEIEKPEKGSHRIDISCDIWEKDPLAGNTDDVIIKHEKPLFSLIYNPADGVWRISGNPVQSYSDDAGKWKVTTVMMPELKSGKKETVTIGISAYIWDWIAFLTKAGWGDMELSFDVEWAQ